ncbi:alpha/beta hydrolase [Paraglaciecola sp. 20A4]|uniref:alpha/beta fold hydrolase n=1 Tax=Paraglaciecola sp. 20A4 TaxID=2687288 RepID=UPI00140D7CA7|nr:alpha/beta hydrolase [Paraglaciecola sp. 20A4]
MPISHHYADINGVSLHYIEAACHNPQDSTQTLIFLHGFPEYWGTWQAQIDYFRAHYRVIVPDLMGYNLSDKPQAQEAYSVPNLIALYAQFVAKISPDAPVNLIAHDWGGAIAWPLAAFHPQLFNKLVILNAAHPSTFTREMATNPKQRQKSAYIHQLVAENGVEFVQQNDFAMLRDMLFSGMHNTQFSERQKAEYMRAWKQPGAVNGMLQYYRAMPQLPPEAQAHITTEYALKIPNIRIATPTLVLWGEQDEAFVTSILDGIEQYVPDCRIQRFSDATHWLHHEKPHEVNASIAQFLAE